LAADGGISIIHLGEEKVPLHFRVWVRAEQMVDQQHLTERRRRLGQRQAGVGGQCRVSGGQQSMNGVAELVR
jgi:hypothetical protein